MPIRRYLNELDLIPPSTTGGILHPRTLYDALKRAQVAAGFATAIFDNLDTVEQV